MHVYFTAVDTERFLRVPQRDRQLDWSAAEVGGPHDPWQRFGAGDDVIPETERSEVAREQAAMPITAEELPDNLKPLPAWPPAPHTAKSKVPR